eukprot:TRINITY_DN15670_c0_g1_i2.p2 TRINITY_DN15670_c0_g1~~TRINITY_DN15670_c0_g1_i2.p2  ORF type:complete len:231 (+),score=37.68 TRINITY_DN15670_c0_g1_i2:36-695(+)
MSDASVTDAAVVAAGLPKEAETPAASATNPTAIPVGDIDEDDDTDGDEGEGQGEREEGVQAQTSNGSLEIQIRHLGPKSENWQPPEESTHSTSDPGTSGNSRSTEEGDGNRSPGEEGAMRPTSLEDASKFLHYLYCRFVSVDDGDIVQPSPSAYPGLVDALLGCTRALFSTEGRSEDDEQDNAIRKWVCTSRDWPAHIPLPSSELSFPAAWCCSPPVHR